MDLCGAKVTQVLGPCAYSEAPDGGWGWVVAAAFFIVEVFTYGFIKSFGIFLEDVMDEFEESNSRVSWVVSICVFVMTFNGPLSSVMTNRFGFQIVVMIGGLLISTGTIATSFTSSVNQMYITYGLVAGLGYCLTFLPTVTILSKYFTRRRSLVTAVASTGESFAMFALAPAFSALRDLIGWRHTMAVIGALQSIVIICGALLRPIIIKPNASQDTETDTLSSKMLKALGPQEDAEHVMLENSVTRNKELTAASGVQSDKDSSTTGGHTSPHKDPTESRCLERSQVHVKELEKTGRDAEEQLEKDGDQKLSVKNPLLDFSILRECSFIFYSLFGLFATLGFFAPQLYIIRLSMSRGVKREQATYMLPTMAVAEILGRFSIGWVLTRKPFRRRKLLVLLACVVIMTMDLVLDVVAPLKLCKSRPRREPWLSDVTRACRRACRSSERKWKKDGLQVSRELFRASLVAYQDAVKAARMAYFADIIETNSNNPKILYKTLNSVLVYQEPSSMSPTAAGNSEAFHKFFVDKVSGIRAVISGNSVDPVPVHPLPPTLSSLNTVSYSELSKLVARQKPSGSPLDVLPPRLWKAAFPCLGPSLGQIINGSLSTGVVPAALKAAVIRPTLKKPGADVSVIENYRPISTLPFTSKLLEKVVYQQLVSHLADSDLFEVFQSGFRSGHSTESALLRVLNDIYLSLDQGTSVLLLLLDLTAAFDTVDHVILLDRLERWVGIKGSALDWFRSYLQNRTFCVKLGDVFSSWEGLRWGVPQGSILGPLLFAIYLLPLGSIFRKHGLSFHLYADDCQIYSPLCQEKGHSIQSFVSCVNEVRSWLMSNYLHLNEGKTELIVFHPNSRNVDRYADLGPLSPYSKPVVISLGVKLDVGLKFDAHINSVIRSSFFHLRRLAKIKPMLSRAHLERVLHAFVISRLDYCNSLYAGLCQSTLHRLQVVQNSAARFLTGTRKRDHISPVLASLHWLPICYRSQFKILVFVYHFFQGGGPPYLATLLNRHSPSRTLRSSDQGLLAVPRSRCRTRGDRAFSVLAPSLWNQLPPSVRLSPSLPVFKNHLKTHLLRLAFPEHV
ncbi:uncharacterized protein [Nothobranchius furzeri]|nr:uncharacterized protein LOC107388189 isoform X2 [Nothobranchius furzeri]